MDGFDSYGVSGSAPDSTVENAMASSGYAQAQYLWVNSDTRTGNGQCLALQQSASDINTGKLGFSIPTDTGIVVGFAIKIPYSEITPLVNLMYDDHFGTRKSAMVVFANATGGITVGFVGSNGQPATYVANSADNIFFYHTWHYVEVKYTPGLTAGTITVRLDGVTVLTYTGQTIPTTNPALVNYVLFECTGYSLNLSDDSNIEIDDLYILSTTTGGTYYDFIGDVVIETLLPASDAGTNQWTQYGGSLTHASAVSDVPSDEDSSYLYSNTSGQIEMFNLSPLSSDVIDVLAMSVHARAKKDAPGSASIKLLATETGNTTTGPATSLPSVYTTRYMMMETAPDSSNWNRTKAVATTIGVEVA
jgi:hypothetical protein